jgi:hypothetical protein
MPNPNLALQQAADLTDKVDPEQQLGAAEIADLSIALATVGLAFEQQTANLIEYLKLAKDDQLPEATPGNIRRIIQRNIEVRLGLA